MKKKITHSAAVLALLSISLTSAEAVTGEAIINPFFDDGAGVEDYTNWTFNAPWRNDGGNQRAVFDVADFNAAGFASLTGAGRDLATAPEITGDPAFTDASNAILTGMTLNSPFLNLFGTAPAEDYLLFFELDVITAGGTFRAQSQTIDVSTIGVPSTPALTTTWLGGGFLGDPSGQAGGGIALSDITGINYSAVVQIVEPLTSGSPQAFLTADNLSVTYDVSFVPEPGSYALLAGLLGLGFVMVRKRK
jgi:hypothetical protein